MGFGQKFFIDKHIALIGFMGAGKTSASELLSSHTGINCVDTDKLIVDITKKTISEIINNEGEDSFRKIEANVLERILDGNKCIISTGGGIVDSAIGRGALKRCYTVWLEVDYFHSRQRIDDLSSRPLFKDFDNASELLEKRNEIYSQYSDFKVNTNNKDVSQVVFDIQNHLLKEGILRY